MKSHFKFLPATAGCVIGLAIAVTAQTLTVADVAREYRKQKVSSGRVLTNESLALRSAPGDTSTPATTGSASASDTKTGDKTAAKTDDSAEGMQKLAAEWKGKIESQKAEIVQLQRELDVSQRENKLRAASFYADAGTRLRDSQKYAEDDKKYQAEAADKQKTIVAAQQALEKMRDEARRAGVPAGQIP